MASTRSQSPAIATFSLNDLDNNDDDSDKQKELENSIDTEPFDRTSYKTAIPENTPPTASGGASPALNSPRIGAVSTTMPEAEDYCSMQLQSLRETQFMQKYTTKIDSQLRK